MHDDEELLRKFCQGDSSAFGELYMRYRTQVFGFALHFLGSEAMALDSVEGVFARMLIQKGTLADIGSFRGWIFTAVRNQCLNDLRLVRRRVALDDCVENGADTDPFESSVQSEQSTLVRRAILGLPTDEREAIILREYHGMRYAEIATVCGTTEGAVKARIFKGRQRLAAILRPYYQEG
jgi:RNA polymerase sigma-70 factor (ECF subfamily)